MDDVLDRFRYFSSYINLLKFKIIQILNTNYRNHLKFCIEYVADIFVSWLPFYYEFKVLFVIWLLTPYTKGASIIYRKILHPLLTRKESEIDQWIDEKQGETVAKIVNVGKSTVQGVANAALTGTMNLAQQGQNQGYVNPMVGQIGTNLISGITNMVNRVSTAATPVDDAEVNPDDRFVELTRSQITLI